MKPTNGNENGCDPISSNCVIWQGPDIDCIDLCKGDNVSQVVNKLALELCKLMDMFDIDNFDLSCFNLAECAPEDFVALIQLLIDKVCACCGVTPEPTPAGGGTAGCPDCEVNICEAFYYNNPSGDQVTTMQLKDYVLAIGNKVCLLTGQIGTINVTLGDQNVRITALENAPDPVFVMPTIIPTCVLPAISTDLDVVLAELESQYCALVLQTGDPLAINTALFAACLGLNTETPLSSPALLEMQNLPGWFPAPVNLAQSFSNLWQTVCDMRQAVSFIQLNCCSTGCADIDLIVTPTILSSTEIRLDFTGTIPNNYTDQAIGSTITITDVNGATMTENSVPLKGTYFDPVTPKFITLSGVNASLDLIIKTTYRFIDLATGSTCENIIQSIALGTATCPDIVFSADFLSIAYSFTWNGVLNTSVMVELYNSLGFSLQSQVLNITTTTPSGVFTNLTENTGYQVRLVIGGVACDFETISTLTYSCGQPTLGSITTDYNTPSGDVVGNTIVGWQAVYDSYHP